MSESEHSNLKNAAMVAIVAGAAIGAVQEHKRSGKWPMSVKVFLGCIASLILSALAFSATKSQVFGGTAFASLGLGIFCIYWCAAEFLLGTATKTVRDAGFHKHDWYVNEETGVAMCSLCAKRVQLERES